MTIPEELLSSLMTSTEEVFETMVFKPLVRLPPVDGDAERKGPNVVATVAIAGHRRGLGHLDRVPRLNTASPVR